MAQSKYCAILILSLPTIIFMPDQPQPNQLNIEISEVVAEGSYANLVIITH